MTIENVGAHRRLAAIGDPLDPTQAPQCSNALCLVQALLNKRPQIYITANINLQGTKTSSQLPSHFLCYQMIIIDLNLLLMPIWSLA